MLLWLIMWTLYGLIVGVIAKAIHRGEDPKGFLATVGIGIAGSYVGGFINFLIGRGSPFQASGLLLGILGGVIFCYLYGKFNLGQYLKIKAMQEEMKTMQEEIKKNTRWAPND